MRKIIKIGGWISVLSKVCPLLKDIVSSSIQSRGSKLIINYEKEGKCSRMDMMAMADKKEKSKIKPRKIIFKS